VLPTLQQVSSARIVVASCSGAGELASLTCYMYGKDQEAVTRTVCATVYVSVQLSSLQP
jgi:hypothetical protein